MRIHARTFIFKMRHLGTADAKDIAQRMQVVYTGYDCIGLYWLQ